MAAVSALWLPVPATVVCVLLAAAAAALPLELRRATAAPNAEIADLREQLARREAAVSTTVHDLRTPLTAIATALELLREGIADTEEDRQRFLDQAAAAAQHMAFLVNDLLDIAALDAGRLRLDPRPQFGAEIAHDVRQVMELMALARDSRLVIEQPPDDFACLGDRGRIVQILFNLVSNAIKYSPTGSEVRIRMRCTQPCMTFEVLDRGPGVPPGAQALLFSRFHRVHGSEVRGTGLGLSLCRELAELMHGSIGYRDRDGGGSVFWFALPPARLEGAAAPARELQTAAP